MASSESSLVQKALATLKWRSQLGSKDNVSIPVDGKRIVVDQTPGGEEKGIGTGATVWDAALITCKFLERYLGHDQLNGKTVLEVGSGTGAVGLAAAVLGAEHVTLTDMAPVMELLQHNVKKNTITENNNNNNNNNNNYQEDNSRNDHPRLNSNKLSVEELNWGEDTSHLNKPFDYILACECVYIKFPIRKLYESLLELTDENTIIILTYEHRTNQSLAFFEWCRESFDITEHELPPEFPCSDIFLYTMKRKNNFN